MSISRSLATQVGTLVGLRRERLDQSQTRPPVGGRVHLPDLDTTEFRLERLRWVAAGVTELPVEAEPAQPAQRRTRTCRGGAPSPAPTATTHGLRDLLRVFRQYQLSRDPEPLLVARADVGEDLTVANGPSVRSIRRQDLRLVCWEILSG
jgi:hypothetical protein